MKTYETYEKVSDLGKCIKRPVIVNYKVINEPFRVNSLEGNYKQGKAGDILMVGIDGELYICDRDVFTRTYEIVQ